MRMLIHSYTDRVYLGLEELLVREHACFGVFGDGASAHEFRGLQPHSHLYIAYVSRRHSRRQQTSADVSRRQQTSADVSIQSERA